jgi:8-oxo-dGTP diphosphatase
MKRVVVAAAVIQHEGRILLTRRPPSGHLAGVWEFPGGKLEPGEAPADAVARECREECGIEVQPVDIFEVTHHVYPEREVLLLFYACRLISGSVQHLEVADHAWCQVHELGGFELPAADIPVLAKLRARGGAFPPSP